MKKTVWLLSLLFVALAFSTTAQVSFPQGTQQQYFKSQNGNPLDAIRQRHAQSANRMANTEIFIDYAASNGDDQQLASFMNTRFVPIDTFGDRYVVVAFDSLHDDISGTGYKYSDFDSIRIDTVYFAVGHENNDGISDSATVKLVQLNASGYPTNITLWSQTFTSGAMSFTGQNNWLQFVELFVAPNLTLPSSTKFGFRIEYAGAKTDTFGYLYSFVDLGACPNLGAPYSADRTAFYPNSFRLNVFNNLLLPTAAGADIFWDCDGVGGTDTDNPVQNINYIAKLTGIEAAGPQVPKIRLLRVNPVTDEVTIKNFGTGAQDISAYRLCSNFSYTANLTTQTLLAGALNLGAGDTVKLRITTINPNAAGSDLGLYLGTGAFADPASMVDFTQWKTSGNGRESVAVAKGIWGAGQFVTNNEPYRYTGNGFQDGVAYWQGTQAPQPGGCDTLSNLFVVDTPSIYGISGGTGYVSGHNSFGDIAKAEEFSNLSAANVTGAFLLFAVAEYANANSTIIARVWDSDGAGGEPGTVLASETLNIIDIAADVAIPDFTYVTFNPPAAVTGNYFIGITFAYANGDTVALITNQGNSGSPNTAWEQWDDNSWNTYASAWGEDFSHFILSEICTQGSCPTITVTGNSTNRICTSVNGTASASATGGTAPYTYAWSNTQTGAALTGLTAGTYTVTATDANSCTGTTTVTVGTTNTVLTVGVTDTDNTSCGAPNGSATASASAGTVPYSYTWSTSGTTATISNLAAGSYTVTAFDANGCSGTGSASVASAPPTIMVSTSSMTPNTQCVNPNGAATVSAMGGTGPYTYQWNAAAGNQIGATASNLAGGTYTVTATDGAGCTGTGNVTVGTTTPTITVSTTSTTPSTSCAAPDGAATVSATGGTGPHTYQWNAAAGNQTGATASNLGGGTYAVTATDAVGCTGTGNVTVTSTTPVITVSVSNSTGNSSCSNPDGSATVSATGGAGPYTFAWSFGQNGATQIGLTEGSYTVTATDDNSCTGTTTVTIADNKPVLNVSIAANPVTSCVVDNGSATATTTGASGTATYTWSTSPAQSSATAIDLAAGNYTVTALDQTSGCTATASTTIGTNTPAVTVTIASTNNVTNCDSPNGSATATASGGAGGFTYEWSTNPIQTTSTATDLAAGSYTVTATSTNGCTASASASVSNNTATITVDITTTVVTSCTTPNGSAIAVATGGTAPYSYSWSSGQTSSTLNNLSAGAYSVTVEDANGCEGSDNTTVGTNTVQPSVTTTVTNETAVGANDGSATATGSSGTAPYTYSWSTNPVQTGATATNLDAGTYTVTLTDANGCAATATAVVGTGVGIELPASISLLSIFPNPTTDVVNVQMELKEMQPVKIEWFNVLGESVIVREFTKVQAVTERFSLGMLPEGMYMVRITAGKESVTSRITVVR